MKTAPGTTDVLANPTVVVEVLSPGIVELANGASLSVDAVYDGAFELDGG